MRAGDAANAAGRLRGSPGLGSASLAALHGTFTQELVKRLLHPRGNITPGNAPPGPARIPPSHLGARRVCAAGLATVAALSVVVLRTKERAWRAYQHGFVRSGQARSWRGCAAVGPVGTAHASHLGQGVTPLAPLLLPYAAIDFDDPQKSQRAVEMAGCSVQYPDGASVCAAIGNNPYAGGFIYLVGGFYAGELTPAGTAHWCPPGAPCAHQPGHARRHLPLDCAVRAMPPARRQRGVTRATHGVYYWTTARHLDAVHGPCATFVAVAKRPVPRSAIKPHQPNLHWHLCWCPSL